MASLLLVGSLSLTWGRAQASASGSEVAGTTNQVQTADGSGPESRRCAMMGALARPVDSYDPPGLVQLRRQLTAAGSSCPSGAATVTQYMDEAVYDQVATATAAVYADHSDTCMPDNCPRAEFIGCVVRFPGHDLLGSATDGFGGQFGGADGCWESSRGLFDCTSGNTLSLLEVYRDVCSQVSLGDFAVIAAEALMAHIATDKKATAAAFKQNFMYGRRCASRLDCGSQPPPTPPHPPHLTRDPPLCSSREGCKHVSLMELPSSQAGCKSLARGFIDRIYAGYNYPMTSVTSTAAAAFTITLPLHRHRSPLTARRSPLTAHRSPLTFHPYPNTNPYPHPNQVRSSICTGTRCAAAPFASGNEGDQKYANMSKAWYLTAAISGARTMAPTQPPKTSGQGSLWFDNGYLKSMLTHGPKFDNGYYKVGTLTLTWILNPNPKP